MIIKLLVEGGSMKPGPAIAQQLGPMGINLGKVISDVNKATEEFKGITVPVNLDVNKKTKAFTIKVLSPPTSQLLKKELGLESGSGARKKMIVGNIAFERVIAVAKTKKPNMLAKDFGAALNSVIGTCMSLGLIIDSKDTKEIIEDVKQGKYKDEIKNQKTEVSENKKKELKEYFAKIDAAQKAELKKQEEEAAAAAEKKAQEQVAAAPGTPGAVPAAATAGAVKPAVTAAAKPEAAKPFVKPSAKPEKK